MQPNSVGIGIEFFILGACLILWGLRRNRITITCCSQCDARLDHLHTVTTHCPQCQSDLRPADARKQQTRKVLPIQMLLGILALAIALVWFIVQPRVSHNISLIIGLELAAFGALAVLYALWGRHQIQHHFCARCEYDLTGIINQTDTCPECGCDLTNKKAICHTSKKIRFRSLIFGFLVIAAGILCLQVDVIEKWQEIEWVEYKFNAWVILDALSELDNATDVDDAWNVDVLRRRIRDDELSKTQMQEVAQSIFRKPINVPKLHMASDVVYQLMCKNMLTDKQLQVVLTPLTSTQVMMTKPSLALDSKTMLFASGDQNMFYFLSASLIELRDIHYELRLDGRLIKEYDIPGPNFDWPFVCMNLMLKSADFKDLVGQTGSLEFHVQGQASLVQYPDRSPVSLSFVDKQDVSIVDVDGQTDYFEFDPAKQKQVDASWVKTLIRPDSTGTDFWLAFEDLPVGLAMTLWAEYDEKEIQVGIVETLEGREELDWFVCHGPVLDDLPEHVNLVLKPDVVVGQLVRRTGYFWSKPIHMKNVPTRSTYQPPESEKIDPDSFEGLTEMMQTRKEYDVEKYPISHVYRDAQGRIHFRGYGSLAGLRFYARLQVKHGGQWTSLVKPCSLDIEAYELVSNLSYRDGDEDVPDQSHIIVSGISPQQKHVAMRMVLDSSEPWGVYLEYDPIELTASPSPEMIIGRVVRPVPQNEYR